MSLISGVQKLYSVSAHRRFGSYCEFGTMLSGKTFFGAEPVKVILKGGVEYELNGIYHRRHNKGRTVYAKMRVYFPRYTNNAAQAAMRQKVRDAVLSWQSLTNIQKMVYNNRAKGKARSGYNIFIKEYLLSH